MPFFSRKKLPLNPPPAKELAQQPGPVCTWSAHALPPGPSPLPFPRLGHTLTATATGAGELFLFGGWAHGCASSDVYVFSTRDFSATLLQTSGEVPTPRFSHGAALIGTTLLICGGKTNFVSREWSHVVVNGPGPDRLQYPTTTVVGSKLFVFGGRIDGKVVNDMWTLDLDSLKSQPLWESYELAPGNEKPLPRNVHVSVTTKDRIIIFGGQEGGQHHYYNDTWSFDISTRKWTELQCTGSIPSPRGSHAAVLVDDVMYVFGGYSGESFLDDLYALQLSTQRWFKFQNAGPSPHRRMGHTMASDGTRVFVLGGSSAGARVDEMSLIHVFDTTSKVKNTEHIKYPEPERTAVNPNEKSTQLAQKSSTGRPTQEQPQHPKSSSSEAHGASRLQNATPAVSGRPASLQITHERNPGPNDRPLELAGVNSKPRRVPEDHVGEGSTEYHAKFAASHSSSEGEVTRLELERQLSVLLAAQTERDQRISRLTDELALKSALLEQAETNAAEAAKRAGLELREHADRLLMQTSLVEQREAELVDMQAKLDELLLSRDQQHEKGFSNVLAKLEASRSELEAVRLRFTDAEKGWTKSKAEANTLRAQIATSSVNRDEDQVTRRLMERVRAIEAEMASKRWNEKSIAEMECRNEE
ncbi:hypothetical protein V8E52_010737 [Russula decolorans]